MDEGGERMINLIAALFCFSVGSIILYDGFTAGLLEITIPYASVVFLMGCINVGCIKLKSNAE